MLTLNQCRFLQALLNLADAELAEVECLWQYELKVVREVAREIPREELNDLIQQIRAGANESSRQSIKRYLEEVKRESAKVSGL